MPSMSRQPLESCIFSTRSTARSFAAISGYERPSNGNAGQGPQDWLIGAVGITTRNNTYTYYASGNPFAGLLDTKTDGLSYGQHLQLRRLAALCFHQANGLLTLMLTRIGV